MKKRIFIVTLLSIGLIMLFLLPGIYEAYKNNRDTKLGDKYLGSFSEVWENYSHKDYPDYKQNIKNFLSNNLYSELFGDEEGEAMYEYGLKESKVSKESKLTKIKSRKINGDTYDYVAEFDFTTIENNKKYSGTRDYKIVFQKTNNKFITNEVTVIRAD